MSYQDFPPALLTLSPRLTRTGDPSASIQGINTTLLGDGCWCYCIENKGEYQFDRADNSTPADGNLVIAPTAGPGRWFRRLPSTGGASAIVQIGWAQVEDRLFLTPTLPVPTFTNVILRNGAQPLQVQLPAVTPGNRLRVDYSGTMFGPLDASGTLALIAVVSFNGVTAYAFDGNFSWINNSGTNAQVYAAGSHDTVRSVTAVNIPPGATTATVQLAYASATAWFVNGTNDFVTSPFNAGVSLEVSEILAASVAQVGPSTLIPYGP